MRFFSENCAGRLDILVWAAGNKDEELRMRIHLEHGAIPTVTIRSAQDIISPNPAVKQMLEIAAG